MNRRRSSPQPRAIALLGKVMNGVMLLVCTTATAWAVQLWLARRSLPYSATGTYFNPQTGITYDEQIVDVALRLVLLFGLLTLLLLFSAYKLYIVRRPHKAV
ncbi:hypothetical protein [Hymenobacter lucidus]|uniref:Uncharacterized protein n=1 Tax=Hymenobacter lucidus TaxID=2880930 RepID=A0ABS8AQK9_9BACT|nr:hypothetical protein [Hymenobacter lucidus]MCB2407596.1 hypothetical protein [Hymenobacter lucidus]